MTTFKALIDSVSYAAVEADLLRLYPDAHVSVLGYVKVFDQLRTMEPAPTQTFSIILDQYAYYDFDLNKDVTYVHVAGRYPGELLPDPKWDGNYAIEYCPWAQWLAAEVDSSLYPKLDAAEIVAHCLWELTWTGYEDKADQKLQEIMTMKDDHLTKAERGELFDNEEDFEDVLRERDEDGLSDDGEPDLGHDEEG